MRLGSLLLLLMLLAGTALAQPSVVVSIGPYGDLLRQLLGTGGQVEVLMPAGASPHTFEPTPRMAVKLADAELVVLNGGVDEWAHDLVRASGGSASVLEVLELIAGQVEGIEVGDDGLHHDDGHHHEDGVNPHVWLDPLLMRSLVGELVPELSRLDPDNAALYERRGEELQESLTELDRQVRELLEPVRGAPFVPYHDAWPYFARRYELDLLVEVEPFPGREPSPAYLAEVIALLREHQVPAIFGEAGLSGRAAQVVAAEAGVELYLLDPLGSSSDGYGETLLHNAAVIREALEAWPSR